MLELSKKMSLHAIYARIQKIQEECLTTREESANLLAASFGIPVYDILSKQELEKLRELRKTAQMTRTKRTEKLVVEEPKKETRGIETPVTPNMLFDMLKFHPRIIEACRSQFKSGHYSDAIFRAYRCIEILVKEKSGVRNESGQNLMHKVFNEKSPVVRLNRLEEDFEIDEQVGFRFIFAGAMVGIRNPKAHAEIEQKDPYRTLEYLSLASLLARRLEEGEKVNA
jgi:uncharacterized protein (TIGR02391 family)